MSFGISKAPSESTTSNSNEFLSQLFNQLTQSNNTGTTSQTGSTTGTTSGATSGSTQRTLTPYQQAVQPQLFQIIQSLTQDPQKFLQPAQNQAREDVNSNYPGVADTLRQQFMSNANGTPSGRGGKAAVMADLARRQDLSKVDNSFSQQAAALPLTAAQLMQQFLGMNFGETSSQNTTGTQSGTSTGGSTTTESGTVGTTGGSQQTRVVDQTSNTKRGVGFNVGV